MDIFIYSDESGVLDKAHNEWFAFGGLVLLGKEQKDVASRMYSKAEKDIRSSCGFSSDAEIKASAISNGAKSKLYRSLNRFYKFGCIINQHCILDRIFQSKKDKQRYLDYVYKISIKRCFESLLSNRIIARNDIQNLFFYVDEHTTATNGLYELREGLERELKRGTYNYNYSVFHQPVFPSMGAVHLAYCNSKSQALVRAADIVANRIYFSAVSGVPLNTSEHGPSITLFP